MQEKVGEENQENTINPLNLSPEDRRNLINFFALLMKIDKRINPHLYKSIKTVNL